MIDDYKKKLRYIKNDFIKLWENYLLKKIILIIDKKLLKII